MRTNSALFRTTGVLVTLLLTFALASPNALAACGQCDDVDIYYEYGGSTGLQVEMDCDYPAGAIIYYTTNGSNPTHDSLGNPGANTFIYGWPIEIPKRQCVNFRARAWKPGVPCYYDSVNISAETICNQIP
ncbi:MAG: chitobiase/beta-hexosaminidase C-terminal domain-containing protein [Chthoniobacterales bacterium]